MNGDIFNLFKNMGFGSMKPDQLMKKLIRQYELNILEKIKAMAEAKIKELSGSASGSQAGVGDMNPFSILGVSMDASEEEVRSAYRKKASEAHPDKGGSNEEMAKVNAAWEVIRRFKGWK